MIYFYAKLIFSKGIESGLQTIIQKQCLLSSPERDLKFLSKEKNKPSEDIMKFSKKKMMMCAALLPVLFSLVGCKKDPNQIDVVFVPSRDATALGESAKKLEPVLDQIMKDNKLPYYFKISTSTTYPAAGTALMNSQADVGFLTGTSYAQMTVDHPGSVEVLLTAQRSGFKVQTTDYKNPNNTEEGRHKQVQAMNGEIDGYEYLAQQDTVNVANSYNSILISNRNHKENGVATEIKYVDDLIGKQVGIQNNTSGAGYNYPKLFLSNMKNEANRKLWFRPDSQYLNNDYIKEHGLTIVSGEPDASKGEIKGVEIKGYDAAFTEVMNENSNFAGVWGFMDIRYSNGYNKTGGNYKDDKSVFTSTYTVAMTDPIFNDTISVRSGLEQEKKDAVKLAFKTAVKQGDVKTDGTGANIIYNIYSHTGYSDGVDANYENERTIYKNNK